MSAAQKMVTFEESGLSDYFKMVHGWLLQAADTDDRHAVEARYVAK